MNYAKIDICDLNNGEGARVTLWVTGCPLHCKGCHNKEIWDKNSGEWFDYKTMERLLDLLEDKYIKGLSILGGEPLAPYNREMVEVICDNVKLFLPDKDIWLWTGYDIVEYEAIVGKLPDVDYIIDGRYDSDLPTTKKWRGSDNQRMFKIKNKKIEVEV